MILPKISIIQPTLNVGPQLNESILSILRQSYNNIEYIIIDGESTDQTMDLVRNYNDKISILVSEKDNGIYDAMNKGAKLSTGNWILFLGGDDLLYNDTIIEETVSYLLNPNLIYYGNCYWKYQNRVYDGTFEWHKLINKNICHQSILYPRKVFENHLFNLKYPVLADWDLNIKLWSQGIFRFKYIDKVITIFNDGYHGKTKKISNDINFKKDKQKIINRAFRNKIFIRKIYQMLKSYSFMLLQKYLSFEK